MRKKPSTIYDLFPRYSKDIVDNAIQQLTSEQLRILNLKLIAYNQDCYQYTVMTNNEIFKSTQIINKIKRYLKVNKNGIFNAKKIYEKNLYEFFEEYPKETVYSIVIKLSDEELNLLKYKYGEDLYNPVIKNELTREQRHMFYSLIVPKIKKALLNEAYLDRKSRGPISIYRYFNTYTKDQIDAALLRLNNVELELLKLKYGENLEYPQTSENMTEINQRQFRILRTKIKRILEKPNEDINSYILIIPEIYKFFRKHKMQNIDFVLSQLNDNEKRLLRVRFAKAIDFYANEIMILREKREIKELLIKMEQQLHDIETKIQIENLEKLKSQLVKTKNITEVYNYIVDILHTPEYQFLLDKYSMKEACVILLKFYCNKNYTIKAMSEILGLDKKEVLEICNSYIVNEESITGIDTKNFILNNK